MANSLLKSVAHNSFADAIFKEIVTRSTRYYYFLGRTLTWSDEINPPQVIDSRSYERDVRTEIIAMKEITPGDIAYVLPRKDWTTGTVYDTYDDQYSTEIQGINLISGGSGYSTAPAITIGIIVPTSTVVSLNSQYYYSGYVYTVTQSGTTGTNNSVALPSTGVIGTQYTHGSAKLTCAGIQATATCTIGTTSPNTNKIISTTITNKGSGYISAPIVSFGGTPTTIAQATAIMKIGSGPVYKIDDANYYVLSNNNIYVCIDNNNGNVSTIAPSGLSTNFLFTSDGYVWKYISTVPINSKFSVSGGYIPVYNAVENNTNGFNSVVGISVDNGGTGYYTADTLVPTNTAVTLNSLYWMTGGSGYVYKVTQAGTTGASNSVLLNVVGTEYTHGTAKLTCMGILMTVTISGDGITSAQVGSVTVRDGKIISVQLARTGSGYSYANVSVSGSGKGAVLSAIISGGNSQYYGEQALIESSTINGQLISIPVISGGYGYSSTITSSIVSGTTYMVNALGTSANWNALFGTTPTANGCVITAISNGTLTNGASVSYSPDIKATITGDGSGASATVFAVGGVVSKIVLTNRGSNYNWAYIILSDTTGVGASARVVIAPYGGLGKDPINNLCAKSLMLYAKFANNIIHGLTVNNDYRQIGIIKDPIRYGDTNVFTGNFGTACWRITATATINVAIVADDIVKATSNSTTYNFRVVNVSGLMILLVPIDNGIPVSGMQFTKSTGVYFTADEIVPPSIDKYSGDMLFIDNESSFYATSGSPTILRTVVNL